MKCIRCDADNNLKDRTANMGRCKGCNHPFAFEPTAMPLEAKLTDPFFAKLITDISANNTLFFTPRQLYYLLDKRLRSRFTRGNLISNPILSIGCSCIPALIGSIIFTDLLHLPFAVVLPIILSICIALLIATVSQNAVSPKANRRIRQEGLQTLKIMSWIILLIGLPVSIIAKTPVGMIGSIVLGISAFWLSSDRQRKQSKIFDNFLVDRTQFDLWLNQWNSINPPEKILPPPETSSLPAAPNPEVTAYSFDRVVVCDSPELAQLLISNNFHFENNCAILSIDRYPQSIFDTTMEMLSRNPDLKVYALHNCSPQGLQLIHRLREEEVWFPDPAIPIIDVGILPRQIMENIDVMTPQSTESARTSQQLASAIRNSLNPPELEWLDAGCYLELESFPPQKLIQILQRAISESRELATIEGDDMVIIDNSPGFYTVESFG
jgi:hypothetical protein